MKLHRVIPQLTFVTLSLALAATASAAPSATYSGVHGLDTQTYWGPGAGQDNIGYSFSGSTGYFFTPNETIEVSALGLMDFGAPGLLGSHTVAIYENVNPSTVPCVGCTMPRLVTGELVAETTLDPGISGDFTSSWGRYVTLPDTVVLLEGVEYYIVADNLGCDPIAFSWFGYCGDADNSDQDMAVFGSTAVQFDSRITWTGYSGASDVQTNEYWDLDESYKIPPPLGVNGNVGPTFWIEEPVCTHSGANWLAVDEWPVDSLVYSGVTYSRASLETFLGRANATSPLVLLWQSLVVTDLNLANGADGSEIQSTRDAAALLVDRMLRPVAGVSYTAEALALFQTLEAWNGGTTGPGACEPVACD